MDIGAVVEAVVGWVLWPRLWYTLCGIVAFVAASYAVHNWRELGILILLAVPLVFSIKWLGPLLGLPVFAEDAITRYREPDGTWVVNAEVSAASIAAIMLASVLMVAWKEIAIRRAEKAAGAKPAPGDRDVR